MHSFHPGHSWTVWFLFRCPARIAAIATEQSLRRELDRIKSQCEALRRENQHLQQRNQDLIEAYWPIMMKLKAYEHNKHHE